MNILDRINQWCQEDNNVKGVILTGSRASQHDKVDSLSDYDLAFIVSDLSFINSNTWLNRISDVMVCINESFRINTITIPTRLVIFENHIKVDFSFYTETQFKTIFSASKLPDGFDAGYKRLVNKNSILDNLPAPSFQAYLIKYPTEKEFEENQKEFWFEVYHVAKYLSREDLWVAKSRDWAVKNILLQMLGWHHTLNHPEQFKMRNDSKGIESWINPNHWNQLQLCFSNLNSKESWLALKKTIQLYKECAMSVSQKLSYKYNQELDGRIMHFIFQCHPNYSSPGAV